MAHQVGHSWQHLSTEIVSYRWEVPGQIMLETNELRQVRRLTLQPDGTIVRVDSEGRRAISRVNGDGTVTQTNLAGTQRQTMRPLGPVNIFEFELFQDGHWERYPPYDWFSWRLTEAQVEEARQLFVNSTDPDATARQLLSRWRGASAITQSDARLAAHQEALRRQQAASPGVIQPSAPAAPISTPPRASARTALVIGVSAYGTLGNLANPVNDARAIAAKLRAIGFAVDLVLDPDQRSMRAAIQRLGLRAAERRGSTALFYFAGHGVQSRGVNYLVPAGAVLNREADLELEAVPAEAVLSQLEESGTYTNIIILDACRNMPLMRGLRSGGGGLAQMDAPNGSFISYSTAPGATALDGSGVNSPYATALIDALPERGQPIEAVFRNVRRSVLMSTQGQQTPWDSSSLVDAFYFVAP